MCHNPINYKHTNVVSRQHGNMTVIALFVIVVVGLLSAALIKLVSNASDTTISQVYGLRAQLTAQSGLQQLLQTSFPAMGNAVACNQTVVSASSLSSVVGMRQCAYQATCTTQVINFANIDYMYFRISSTGTCSVGSDVISRTLSVDATEEISP